MAPADPKNLRGPAPEAKTRALRPGEMKQLSEHLGPPRGNDNAAVASSPSPSSAETGSRSHNLCDAGTWAVPTNAFAPARRPSADSASSETGARQVREKELLAKRSRSQPRRLIMLGGGCLVLAASLGLLKYMFARPAEAAVPPSQGGLTLEPVPDGASLMGTRQPKPDFSPSEYRAPESKSTEMVTDTTPAIAQPAGAVSQIAPPRRKKQHRVSKRRQESNGFAAAENEMPSTRVRRPASFYGEERTASGAKTITRTLPPGTVANGVLARSFDTSERGRMLVRLTSPRAAKGILLAGRVQGNSATFTKAVLPSGREVSIDAALETLLPARSSRRHRRSSSRLRRNTPRRAVGEVTGSSLLGGVTDDLLSDVESRGEDDYASTGERIVWAKGHRVKVVLLGGLK